MTESEVLKEIKDYLSRREMEHPPTVLWFERLASGKVKTEWGSYLQLSRSGTPDIVCIFINADKRISVLFVEVKSSDIKAVPRVGKQLDFMKKYQSIHTDVHYMIAQSWQQVSAVINSLSHHPVEDIDLV
jgi:hypothetical protein